MPRAVILTALPVEYLAVRSHLSDLQEKMHPQGTIYERGKFAANGQEWEVGIVETGAGNAGAAVEAERAIAYFKPDVLIFVGIAGGIKDVAIGDVVAATKVYGYESGKVGEQFFTRPAVGQSAYALVQRAKSEARKDEWLQRLSSTLTTQPRVFIAPIASGEKVVASRESELFKFLRASYNDAVAIAMEGFGFLSAASAYPEIKAIVIRGISDLIKDKNEDSPESGQEPEQIRQQKASYHASAFAFEILAKLSIDETNSKVPNKTTKSTKPVSPNFFAYDDAWVGRDSLIQELSDRVRASCRLLILLGITGIGKTALGERIAVELADWFDEDWSNFHQENFDDEQQSSDFASVAARWLEKWGELITPDDRKDPQRLLYRLIAYLKENRRLIQMDSLENILKGNEEEGWNSFKDEWWIKFFESYLKADSCQSSIILTSQDLPGQLEDVGKRSQNFWYCQPLSGLDKLEQIELFNKTGLDVSETSDAKPYLERIGNAYEGHALALRVIAGEIKNKPFEGNVVSYWRKYGIEVEEVEKAIAEAQEGVSIGVDDKWQLDRFTKTLRRNVRSRLNKTFARLKEDAKWAYILLCEASVYRCSVPEDFWLSHLEDWDRDEVEQRSALDALRDRYMVEELIDRDQCLLRQHNLIRSTALEHLHNLDLINV
jgi:nucleoside phosphorylase